MTQKIYDRVRETTTTTGTGTVTLGGAVAGFRTFSSVLSNTDTAYYCIEDTATGDWEVGVGTYSSNTLARTTILASSNGGAAVSFAAGTKQVFITMAADGINAMPVGNREASTGVFTSLTSTSGALNGTIGAGTPNTGAFTTLSATGVFSSNTSNSTAVLSATGARLLANSTYGASIAGFGSTYDTTLFDRNIDARLGVTTAGVAITGTLSTTGSTYINDTSNANMTTGLTINQGAADNEILALKSSDVAHGMTDLAETDTFCGVSKYSALEGGFNLFGYSEGTVGVALYSRHTTDNTAKTTAAVGGVLIAAQLKVGTSAGSCGADANLLVIQNSSTSRFIFDAEGSAHADVEWVAFDKYDDMKLLNALDVEMHQRQRDPIKREFSKWVRDSRAILQREKVFNFYDSGPRAMMNMTRMHMLEVGAIRQLGRTKANRADLEELIKVNVALQKKVARLERKLISH